MDSNQIEQIGINDLERLFLKTKIITPNIHKMDKYPIWDGEIILYKSENKNNDNINFRIPIQVKTECLKSHKNEEFYDIKLTHLKKYATEGGVLFVKVLYNKNADNSEFYMKNLMKGEINDILKSAKKDQLTKRIILKQVLLKDLIPLCMNFNLHREMQMQLPNFSNNQIKNVPEIHSFGYIRDINDILKEEQYAYARLDYDVYAYIGKINFKYLSNELNMEVKTKTKKYFDKVTLLYEKDKKSIIINKYVKLENNNICISNNMDLDATLEETVFDLEFILDLYKNKNIKIGVSEYLNLNFCACEEKIQNRIQILENNLKYFIKAKFVLEKLNIPLNVKIKDVIKDEINVCKINDIINNNKLIKFKDINSESFIDIVEIFDYVYLIYFEKQKNGLYKGYDFIHNQRIYNNLIVNDNGKVQLSRYFNLTDKILSKMILNNDEIINEIKKVTKNEITIVYINNLMLEFIKAYDICKKNLYLTIADNINRILRKQREFYDEDLFKINKYQILKRINKLSDEDKEKIKKTILLGNKKPVIKCSYCLLLDEYDVFMNLFKELDIDEKNAYLKWPIYNLLPDKYRIKEK